MERGKSPTTVISELLVNNDITTILHKLVETLRPEGIDGSITLKELESTATILSMNLSKTAPYYGPFNNVSRILRDIASLAADKDSILYGKTLLHIWSCLVDALYAYTNRSLAHVKRTCMNLDTDKLLVHNYGNLTYSCLLGLREKNPMIFITGTNPKNLARKLVQAGYNPRKLVIVPVYYSYQASHLVDTYIFQAETVSVERMLSRPGVQLTANYIAKTRTDARIIPLTLSLAYITTRGKGLINYTNIMKMPYELEWKEIEQLPLFEIVYIKELADKLTLLDEQGQARIRTTEYRRRLSNAHRRILELVDARCRVFQS
ncbi:MAG: hypothetical protein GSR72_05560 [Desulfurococcales archaeon]|nr:hypothetical protein [Desulfurococcales archaeon]